MNIKVLIKHPQGKAYLEEIENHYKNIQKIVGGLFDYIKFPLDDNVDVFCNDEFLNNNMKANLLIPEYEMLLAGPIVFVGFDSTKNVVVSLTNLQIKTIKEYLEKNQSPYEEISDAYNYLINVLN